MNIYCPFSNCGRPSLKACPANKKLQPVPGAIVKGRTRNCGAQRRGTLWDGRGKGGLQEAGLCPLTFEILCPEVQGS